MSGTVSVKTEPALDNTLSYQTRFVTGADNSGLTTTGSSCERDPARCLGVGRAAPQAANPSQTPTEFWPAYRYRRLPRPPFRAPPNSTAEYCGRISAPAAPGSCDA